MVALVERIEALLPQTQCQRCGYVDCHTYAEAIASGDTGIDRCPPGGQTTLQALAVLTGRTASHVDSALGDFIPGQVAFIIEPECIGCTKCIQACPVDAIVGAAKQMHTVIEALCTGCELCIPACPVDCIQMRPVQGTTQGATVPVAMRLRTDFFRARYHSRNARLADEKTEQEEHLQHKASGSVDIIAQRKAEIAAAVARVQAKRIQRALEANKYEP